VTVQGERRRRIRYLGFGGTIASVAVPGSTEARPTLSAADVLASVPQIADVADVEPKDFPTIASYAVTVQDMLALAREAVQAFEEGFDAVVVSHGTDTIEETAYALALTVPRGRPIVLTGALRNPSLPGPDGPANLLAAVRVAAVAEAGTLGPLVVLNDELHTARFATKTHTSRPSTFASPGAGPVGELVEGRVDLWFRPLWEDYLGLPDSVDRHAVELIRVAAGIDDTLMRAAIGKQPDGIVLEGFGGGHLPLTLLPALDDAIAAGIAVVVATRGVAGPNLERTYRLEGAETDLIERGALTAGAIGGHKARLRLLVGSALGRSPRSLFPVR
jgi:L-asparaginase